jgi:hypothetical protein
MEPERLGKELASPDSRGRARVEDQERAVRDLEVLGGPRVAMALDS